MSQLVTIYDVAREAQVAASTVSRAFSKPGRVNAGTARVILETAERLGYEPNKTARSLSTGRTNNLAVLVPNISNPFFAEVMRAFQVTAHARNYSVFLVDIDESSKFDTDLMTRIARQVDGMALVSLRIAQTQLDEVVRGCGACVLVNRRSPGTLSVTIDSTAALAQAVDSLHALGHTGLVYGRGPAGGWSDRLRRQALRRLCSARGIDFRVTPTRMDDLSTARVALDLVEQTGAHAVLSHSDLAAIAVLSECRARGIEVPHQVSVLGHDDIDVASVVYPSLSTIAARTDVAGAAAAEMLLRIVEHGRQVDGVTEMTVPASFVQRSSVAAPPRRAQRSRPRGKHGVGG